MRQSVLSHLATRFAVSPENLATEALAYVLDHSVIARQTLAAFASHLAGIPSIDALTFKTQDANDDASRPDLVGKSSDGTTRLVIEAKFWAGLTAAQPVGYLKSLPADGALLLFVAPADRIESLWPELVRRLGTAGYSIGAETPAIGYGRSVRIGQQTLAICSWRDLLQSLHTAVEVAGEGVAADIRQLLALCDRMDSEAFLPLQSEELTSAMGSRITQFGMLVNDLTENLVASGYASVKGLRATAGNGWYGRYLRVKGHGCLLHFQADYWAHWADSPIWLRISGPDFKARPASGLALREAGICVRDTKFGTVVPIPLQLGVEREYVIDRALHSVRIVIDALPELLDLGLAPPPAFDTGIEQLESTD